MSNYLKFMGAEGSQPETLEDYSFHIISKLLMVIRFMERGDKQNAEQWMTQFVLPSLEEYYKLNKDPKFGVFSESQLWRKGDYQLYCEELRKQYGLS